MSDNPAEVYRTRNPEALEAYDNYTAARTEWLDKVHDFCEKHSGTSKGWFNYFLRSEYFIGLVAPEGDTEPLPGWRIESKNKMMVPAKRTPEGKRYAAEMAKLKCAPVFHLGGMPQDARGESTRDGGTRIYAFGVEHRDDYLEVTWGVPVPQDQIDFEIWEKVPLSQWHAEREAAESGG